MGTETETKKSKFTIEFVVYLLTLGITIGVYFSAFATKNELQKVRDEQIQQYIKILEKIDERTDKLSLKIDDLNKSKRDK